MQKIFFPYLLPNLNYFSILKVRYRLTINRRDKMAYIRKKGNKWYFTITYVNEKGERKYSERVGGFTKSECKEAYAKMLCQLKSTGKLPISSREEKKVADLLHEWLNNATFQKNKTNTLKRYESVIRIHIIPALGNMKLASVKPKHLQDFINEKSTVFKQSTINQITTVLKQAFRYAVKFCEYLTIDPTEPVTSTQSQKKSQKKLPFKKEHIDFLFNKYPLGHQYHAPCIIAYHTGMRLGECLALKWDDIDMKNRTINVTKTVIVDKGIPIIQAMPKSNASIRIISFGETLYNELNKIKVAQNRIIIKYGPEYFRNNLICDYKNGHIFNPDTFGSPFNFICRKNFGKGYSFHSFRHLHATMLLEAGVELEIVSKRLGHANINLTASIYSHILEKRKDKLTKQLNEIL